MNLFQSFSSAPILGVLIIYIILIFVYKEGYTYHYISNNVKTVFGVFLILILCLYAVQDTDYFHYMEELNRLKLGHYSNLENVYVALAKYVNYEYIPFRFIVWGSAIILFIITIYRVNQPISLVLFYFVAMYLLRFSYARVSLAMAMGILGYTFLIKPINASYLSYIIGFAIIYCSTFFHKSAIIFCLIYPLSLIRLNKKNLFILLLLYPFIIYFVENYAINYLMMLESDSRIINSAISYANAQKHNHGISRIIRNALNYTPYYLSFILIVTSVIKGEYGYFDKIEQLIINVSFFTIYIATIFFFNRMLNTQIIFYRFLYYSILPLSLLFTIYKNYDLYPKLLKIILGFGVLLCIYELLYSFYTSSLLI